MEVVGSILGGGDEVLFALLDYCSAMIVLAYLVV
jgi:hypothetical protein